MQAKQIPTSWFKTFRRLSQKSSATLKMNSLAALRAQQDQEVQGFLHGQQIPGGPEDRSMIVPNFSQSLAQINKI